MHSTDDDDDMTLIACQQREGLSLRLEIPGSCLPFARGCVRQTATLGHLYWNTHNTVGKFCSFGPSANALMVEGYAVTSCNFASRETRNQAERICFEDRSRGKHNYVLRLGIFLVLRCSSVRKRLCIRAIRCSGQTGSGETGTHGLEKN